MFLKPAGAKGNLPAILALHDHSGRKYFGHRKISRPGGVELVLLRQYVDEYYEGVWWANDAARRRYAVLVPDAFLFGSRRVTAPAGAADYERRVGGGQSGKRLRHRGLQPLGVAA